jgi:hypothetical protein
MEDTTSLAQRRRDAKEGKGLRLGDGAKEGEGKGKWGKRERGEEK